MKTFKTFLAISIVAFLFSSCAHSIYPAQSMFNNYNSRMKSEEELSIKSKVNIYFFEKDIKGEYEILSANTYKPFCLLPFQSIFVKKMNKKFLKAAVLKAYDEGGNAILVQGGGFFFVLNLKDWKADEAAAASFVNPIFDTKLSEIMKSGSLASKKRGERTRTENMFVDEIESNISNIVSLEEVEAVREKVKILSDYNLSLKRPQKDLTKKVEKFTKKCNSMEKKIKKAEAKKSKQAAKKQ